MGREIGVFVMPRDVCTAVVSLGLDWYAFARPTWDGYMEARNDR